MLLSEDREERNWDKADDNYKDVQRFIIKAEHLELYDDVERLIPKHVKPECVEMVMEIEEYAREEPNAKERPKSPMSKVSKRVRNDDVMRNIPTGASTTFVSVKDLLKKGTKKRKKAAKEFDDGDGEDDSDDLDIAAGITGPRRTVSMPIPADKGRKKLKQSATMPRLAGGARPSKKQSKKKITSLELTASQFDKQGKDDSEDDDIAKGFSLIASKPVSKCGAKISKPQKIATVPSTSSSATPATPEKASPMLRLSSIELSSSPGQPLSLQDNPRADQRNCPVTPSPPPSNTLASGGVIDLTTPADPVSSLDFRWSSPDPIAESSNATLCVSSSVARAHCGPLASPCGLSAKESTKEPIEVQDSSMAWLLDDDDDDDDLDMKVVNSSPIIPRVRNPSTLVLGDDSSEPEVVDGPRFSPSPSRVSRNLRSPRPAIEQSRTPVLASNRSIMPPPAIPTRFKMPESPVASSSNDNHNEDASSPALTFAVRRPGDQPKNKRARVESFGSSPLDMAPAAQRRIQRERPQELQDPVPSPKPRRRKKRKFADVVDAQRHNPWIDVEASHSGDELSVGGSEDDEALTESDRQFLVGDSHTQASPSYDQTAVYRRSLMTQLPGGSMPVFAKRPIRGLYGGRSGLHQRTAISDSSPRGHDSDDNYMFGSFVVDDDAEISYADDTQLSSDL